MAERVRDFKAVVKAAGTADGLKAGQFRALVSTYSKDTYGDRVIPGAFADDIERWNDGDVLPIVWSHQWNDPFSHIGTGIEAKETDDGLDVFAELHDLDENPTAKQVHRLLTGRRVTQFSFAFDVLDGGWSKEDGEEVYELRRLKTFEVGPCLVGVNQETQLLDAKAHLLRDAVEKGRELPAGIVRELEETTKALREVIDLSRSKMHYDSDEGSEDSSDDSATAPAPEAGKADRPSSRPRLALVDALFMD